MSRWQQRTDGVPLNLAALLVGCPTCCEAPGYPCRLEGGVPHHLRKDRVFRLLAYARKQTAARRALRGAEPVPDSHCTALGLEERRRQGVEPRP